MPAQSDQHLALDRDQDRQDKWLLSLSCPTLIKRFWNYYWIGLAYVLMILSMALPNENYLIFSTESQWSVITTVGLWTKFAYKQPLTWVFFNKQSTESIKLISVIYISGQEQPYRVAIRWLRNQQRIQSGRFQMSPIDVTSVVVDIPFPTPGVLMKAVHFRANTWEYSKRPIKTEWATCTVHVWYLKHSNKSTICTLCSQVFQKLTKKNQLTPRESILKLQYCSQLIAQIRPLLAFISECSITSPILRHILTKWTET